MNILHRLLFAVLVSVSLSACVQVIETERRTESQLAISSVFEQDVKVQPNQTFNFMTLKHNDNNLYINEIGRQISQYLENNQLVEVNEDAPSDYTVVYFLRKEGVQENKSLTDIFGIDPGLHSVSGLNKGTLMIAVLDAPQNKLIWKAATQGFIMENSSPEEKKERIQRGINSTLSQFVYK